VTRTELLCYITFDGYSYIFVVEIELEKCGGLIVNHANPSAGQGKAMGVLKLNGGESATRDANGQNCTRS
jgi:hypothetical protein